MRKGRSSAGVNTREKGMARAVEASAAGKQPLRDRIGH